MKGMIKRVNEVDTSYKYIQCLKMIKEGSKCQKKSK